MKNLIVAGPVAAMLLATASCSGTDGHGSADSYLTASNSKVAFIHLRIASNGHLQGTITENGIGGIAPTQTLSTSSERFTGTMRGKSVTLTFASMYFLHTGAHGVLSDGVLTMRVPQSDGAIQQLKFIQSDKAGYDRAIAALHRRIRHANLLAAKQHAGNRQRPAYVEAERSSQRALSKLSRDSSVASGGVLADDLAGFAHHIHAARGHLAAAKKDSSHSNKYCVAALSVAGDAKAVDGAVAAVQGDVLSLRSDILVIRQDLATTSALLRHSSKAGVTVPKSASNVIPSAKVKIKHAIARANSYIDQINATDARARSIAHKLAMGPCSGAQYGSSVRPIPHIR